MASGKLRMKRTPEEQAARDLRKARKAARKASRNSHRSRSRSSTRSKRRRTDDDPRSERANGEASSSHFQEEPHSGQSKPDWEFIRAQAEEERFREKLWGAFDDDERLDSVEAKFNSYAHIPRRWRSGGMDTMDDDLSIDPQFMEEEDYAEWIRVGIWRKKHAAEHEEQLRVQAERDARVQKEKALQEETERLQRASEDERRRRKMERQQARMEDARAAYEAKWKDLLDPSADSTLAFEDVPWPTFDVPDPLASLGGDEYLTPESVLTFLIPKASASLFPLDAVGSAKIRKEKLRETLLRFHPDKFEGRILRRVRDEDRGRVKETVEKLVRIVNSLAAEK